MKKNAKSRWIWSEITFDWKQNLYISNFRTTFWVSFRIQIMVAIHNCYKFFLIQLKKIKYNINIQCILTIAIPPNSRIVPKSIDLNK